MDELSVFRGDISLQLGFIRNRMDTLGKAAQVLDGRGLTFDFWLRSNRLVIELKAVFHKFEVGAQRIGELDVRGI